MRATVRASKLRADTAVALIDVAVARPTFTVRQAHDFLEVSYPRANALIGQLMELGVLDVVDAAVYKRRFFAPAALRVLLASEDS